MRFDLIEEMILFATSNEYHYIARDKSGDLYLYEEKPTKLKSAGIWAGKSNGAMRQYNYLFKDIKWKNKEPYRFRD